MDQGSKVVGIAAVVAVVLQLVVAPNIRIMGIMPDFLVSFVLTVCLLRSHENHYVLAFVMGMVSDLMGTGVVGSMALCLLLASVALRAVGQAVGADNPASAAALLMGFSLVVLLVYSFILSSSGLLELPQGLLFFTIPCALYDGILGIVWFLVCSKLMGGAGPRPGRGMSSMPNLRFD